MCVAPGFLIYVVNLISFIDLDLIKNCEIEIDRLHVCLDIFYCSLFKVYYWDLLISCHVRNNNYEFCKVWIFENKIASITCAYMNVKIYCKYQLIK